MKLNKCISLSKTIDVWARNRPGKQVAQKITKIFKWLQYPTNLPNLRSFLRLCNVYRKVVSNFKRRAFPLNKILKSREPQQINLDDENSNGEDKLNDKLITPLALTLNWLNGKYTINTDA